MQEVVGEALQTGQAMLHVCWGVGQKMEKPG